WAASQVLQSWIGHYGVPRALYTDWKRLQTQNYAGRADEGRSSADAVRTHVPEAGDPDHCCQFPAGQRTSGAETRGTSGSADQENAAERDRELRGGERIPGAGVLTRSQSPFLAARGQARGLSRA